MIRSQLLLSPLLLCGGIALSAAQPGESQPAPQLRPLEQLSAACDVADLWQWRCVTRQMIEEGHELDISPEMSAAGLSGFDDLIRQMARAALENGTLAEIQDDDFVVGGKAFRTLDAEEWSRVGSVSAERHHALDWFCGNAPENRWDAVPITD